MISTGNKIKQIIKLVNSLYNPHRIRVIDIVIKDRKVYTIGVYFEEIPDTYLTNPQAYDTKKNKEYNLNNEIRTYIENYLGIKTTGLQPKNNFYPPPEDHGITIVTQSDK